MAPSKALQLTSRRKHVTPLITGSDEAPLLFPRARLCGGRVALTLTIRFGEHREVW